MKASREQEMRYFQMMCGGLMNPTVSPNPLANGNPHHYHSPTCTLQPFYYGTSPKEDQHQLSGFQALNQSVQQNSVFLHYSASSCPRTPSSSSPLTVSPGSADQSFLNHVQAAGASQQQGFVPQYEELRPRTPTYMKIQLVLLKVVGMSQEDLASSLWTETIVKPTSCNEDNFPLCHH